MRRILTENSHLGTKARIRADFVKQSGKKDFYVLDAFAGDGLVWQRVRQLVPDVNIAYLGIDKKKYSRPEVIMGDNRKVLPGLDLHKFDLIDLDAFGCPNEQLEIVAAAAPDVPVASTCVFVTLAPVPKSVLDAAGIPEVWRGPEGAPQSLFARWRWQMWDNYLFALGYRTTDFELHLDKPSVKRYEILTRNL